MARGVPGDEHAEELQSEGQSEARDSHAPDTFLISRNK
jgi:hypothetical protein